MPRHPTRANLARSWNMEVNKHPCRALQQWRPCRRRAKSSQEACCRVFTNAKTVRWGARVGVFPRPRRAAKTVHGTYLGIATSRTPSPRLRSEQGPRKACKPISCNIAVKAGSGIFFTSALRAHGAALAPPRAPLRLFKSQVEKRQSPVNNRRNDGATPSSQSSGSD